LWNKSYPRIGLATVRLVMGSVGLFAPTLLMRRLSVNPKEQPGMAYPFRMFGIRTVLIGTDLLRPDGLERQHAVRVALLIHATDVFAAVIAAVRGELPRRAALAATTISGCNVLLSLGAWLLPNSGRPTMAPPRDHNSLPGA